MVTATATVQLTEDQLTRFTGYPVALPAFEGPLDLLLYLIRRQEIDIYDIPIATITQQFLAYLTLMEELDIEVAADFLVMAATLLEIKSRMLLPRPPAEPAFEDEEEEDPRAELVRRLLEYQQYKSAAGALLQRAEEQKLLFARSTIVPHLSFARPDPSLDGNPDAFSLWGALQELMARMEAAGPTVREVVRPAMTIRRQMMTILRLLEATPNGVPFSQLFLDASMGISTRFEVIVTFLAMLELMRLRRITIIQRSLFGEITIKAAMEN